MIFRKEYLMEFNFKSGKSVRVWLKKYSISSNLSSVNWTDASGGSLVAFRIEEVESVVCIKTRLRLGGSHE